MNKFEFINWSLTKSFVSSALLLSSLSVFATVKAPPLPLGSAQTKIEAGQSPAEQKRMLNAHKHHHPGHYKKDLTRDDTIDDKPELRFGNGTKNSTPSPLGGRTGQ